MQKRGRLLTVTQTANLLGESAQTVRYYIREAQTLRAMQPPAKEGQRVSKSRYKIREADLLDFAAKRGATPEELAALQADIAAIQERKRS